MDIAVPRAVSQLYLGSPHPMSATETEIKDASVRRRVRNGAWGLAALALALYFGFMALLVYHSHH
jgi:hypothetical protein